MQKKQLINILLLSFVFLFVSSVKIKAQTTTFKKYRFKPFKVEDGLSHNRIFALFQDSHGYLWIGTEDGLNKYDGFTFTIYKNNEFDSTSVCGNIIRDIYEDRQGDIWISTQNGISKYSRELDNFQSYTPFKESDYGLDHYCWCVFQDSENTYWVGTMNRLIKFNPDSGTFNEKYQKDFPKRALVNHIFEDNNKNVWFLIDSYNLKYSLKTGKIKKYRITSKNYIYKKETDEFYIIGKEIKKYNKDTQDFIDVFDENTYELLKRKSYDCAIIDSESNYWIGSRSYLINYNLKTQEVMHAKHNSFNPKSISNATINCLLEDNAGIIWIGTENGLNKLDKQYQVFKHIYHERYNENSLPNNNIGSIADVGNKIYINCSGYISVYDKTKDQFTNTPQKETKKKFKIETEDLQYLSETDKIAFYNKQQIALYDHKKEKTEQIIQLPKKMIIRYIRVFNDKLWIATRYGLIKLNINTNKTTIYTTEKGNKNSLSYSDVRHFVIDDAGIFWLATAGGGLNRFDPQTETFKIYKPIKNDTTSISSIMINYTFFDKNNQLWIATKKGGLCKYNKETDNFTTYWEKDGLPSNLIYTITEDNNSNLWLSTNRGLSCFNPKTKKFKNYTINDGLQGNDFNFNSVFKNKKGEIYLGGENGLTVFNSKKIKPNPDPPIIDITELSVLNKKVIPSKDGILQKDISETEKIILTHKENIFSFSFSALHFAQPEKNQYAYQLKGFNKDWVYTNAEEHYASFSNIPAGKYAFMVKAANKDGIWSKKTKEITIIIKPPYWETWWFRISVSLFLFGSVYLIYYIRVSSIKKQKKALEEKNNQLEKQKQKIVAQTNEIKKQAIALEKSNTELEKLSIVASKTENAVIVADAHGNIEWVNESFTRATGFNLQDLLDARGRNIIGNDTHENTQKIIQYAINEKKPVHYEDYLLTSKDTGIWMQVSLTPIVENEVLKKLVIVDSDITKIKEAETKIKKQKHDIEIKNEQIKSSIEYALTIQRAILPIKNNMEKFFEAFVIYKPKDIVSGDFYWFSVLPKTNELPEQIFVAAVDCTGHGVPGAFMSMIGNSLLNEIVKEKQIASPAKILHNLHLGIISALRQKDTHNDDGMDACLVKIIRKKHEQTQITFAGAKRPLFVMDNQKNEYTKIIGTRKSLGGTRIGKVKVNFTENEILLNKGDMIYLTSDGIIDQSNPARIRFGSKRFVKLLKENSTKSLEEQKNILETALAEHQQNEAQRDDITVIGIKI